MKLRFVKIIASAAPLKNYCSFHCYAKGVDDDIIKKKNPLYFDLGDAEQTRQQRYREYLFQDRPYEYIVDTAFSLR